MNKVQIAMWALINHLEGPNENDKEAKTFYLTRLRKALEEEAKDTINATICKLCNVYSNQMHFHACININCPSRIG